MRTDSKNSILEDLKHLIDNIPFAVWIKGSDGIYRYVNKYYAQIADMTPEDLIGKSDYDIKDRETAKRFLEEDNEFFKNGKTVFHRKTPIKKEFKNFFEVSRIMLEEDDNVQLIGGIGKNTTINEILYKEIEKSTLSLLNDAKQNTNSELPYILKDILKTSGITIFIFDEKNRRLNMFLKTYNDDVIPKDYSIFLSRNDEKKLLTVHNKNFHLENEYMSNNVLTEVKTYPIKYENKLIGILNLHYNNENKHLYAQEDKILNTCDRLGIIITNRILTNRYKEELQRRKESEQKLQMFLENAVDFHVVLTSYQNIFEEESDREKFENFFGYSFNEITQKVKDGTLRHPEDQEIIETIYRIAKEYGRLDGVIVRYLCRNGEYKSIEWSLRYIIEQDRFFLTGRDITYRIKLEEEKRELEKNIELESLKTEFFANMSHEFKTPLNIILTTVQVLTEKLNKSNNMQDDINRYLKGIKQNSYRLLKIVNNIMDVTKIDSGSYNLELSNHNIVSIVEDIVLSVVEYVKENKKNIIFDTTEEEIFLACDPMKIERIILNLLSNALKYTYEQGEIEVFIDTNSEKNEVIISVTNDGDPITEEDKEKIFNRFTQSENLFTRKAEGTGIGLFLVRLLVELHGGIIYVDTSFKTGAKFVVRLPIRLIEKREENYTYKKQITAKIETCNIEFSDIYSI